MAKYGDALDFIIALTDMLGAVAKGIKKLSKIVTKKSVKLSKSKLNKTTI